MRTLTVATLPRHPPEWQPTDLAGQKVLVVGLGTFGGGVGVTRYLVRQGAAVTVTDKADTAALEESLAALAGLEVRYVLGGNPPEEVDRADWVVASPAVPWSAPLLVRAAARGTPVETELSLLVRRLPGSFVGVTGTNGKSTVAGMLARALAPRGGTVRHGGNLGGSLLDQVDGFAAVDPVVLEVSSFQLEHLEDQGLGPRTAVLTNLTPDHLDRHGTFAQYVRAKQGILCRATHLVAAHGDPVCRRLARRFSGRLTWFGLRPAWTGEHGLWLDGGVLAAPDGRRRAVDGLPLKGPHNALNLAAAVAAAMAEGVDFDAALDAAWDTPGLPHRLQELATIRGVRYVDDSVSTSPPAVLAALSSFPGGIRLLVGGYDKGIDPGAMLDEIPRRCRKAYLYGAVAGKLAVGLAGRTGRAPGGGAGEYQGWSEHADLEAAFRAAVADAEPGDVVLLSPGFASYDQFRNFTQRAALFQDLVGRLGVA